MKNLLFLFIILIGGNFFAQERFDNSEVENIDGSMVLKLTGKPITGIWYENYDKNQLKFEKNIINGKRAGQQKHYSQNGKSLGEVNLIDGNGILQVKYENGKLEFEVTYKNGMADGLYKWWHENGQLGQEINYENGIKNGLFREWFENGKLALEINYLKNSPSNEKIFNETGWWLQFEKIHGSQKYFNKDGKLIKEFLDGVVKEFDENGILIDEYALNRIVKNFSENGKLISESKGFEDIEYNQNGLKIKQYDIMDGDERTWYDNGQLKSFFDYTNDDMLIQKYYFENGKLMQERTIKGEVVMSNKCFNEKGKEVDCKK